MLHEPFPFHRVDKRIHLLHRMRGPDPGPIYTTNRIEFAGTDGFVVCFHLTSSCDHFVGRTGLLSRDECLGEALGTGSPPLAIAVLCSTKGISLGLSIACHLLANVGDIPLHFVVRFLHRIIEGLAAWGASLPGLR